MRGTSWPASGDGPINLGGGAGGDRGGASCPAPPRREQEGQVLERAGLLTVVTAPARVIHERRRLAVKGQIPIKNDPFAGAPELQ